MKKKALFVFFFVILMISALALNLIIRGSTPRIENFDEVSEKYEAVAQIAFDTYKDCADGQERICIDTYDGKLIYDGTVIALDEESAEAVKAAGEEFDYLYVYENAVFFCEDETGYYGLVYSQHPIAAMRNHGLFDAGRDYNRINSCWYEWGCFGL